MPFPMPMPMPRRHLPPGLPVRWRRRLAAGALAAGVLALHGSGLHWLAPGPARAPGPAIPVMQVRQWVSLPAPAPLVLPQPAPVRAQRGAASRRQELPPTAEFVSAPAAPEIPSEGWVPVAAAATPTAAARTTPTYPTRMAPPFEARYRMHRGAVSGDASLHWRHDDKGYQLRLDARVLLLGVVLTQQSTGGFDAAGLAPQRFVERRWRRGARAVNFVRPADGSPPHISFSARSGQMPWMAGMQDRLSWIVQLGAIAAAWPQGGPHLGETIELDVAGPAGEVQHWIFSVAEAPAAGTEGETLKLVREPGATYDTAVQVWLDPTHHYQLQRLRLAEARGDALELVRVVQGSTP